MNVSQEIENYISSKEEWKQNLLTELRSIIQEVDSEIKEAWKWKVPVFTKKKDVCSIASFKNHVKLNFFKGAHFEDPDKIFNAGLEAKNSRSIDFKKGEKIPQDKVKKMLNLAIEYDSNL